MQTKNTGAEAYINSLPDDRRIAIGKICKAIKNNLPKGFEECISYGMIGYVVPHAIYPNGYHCNPLLPLPFINVGNKKKFISLHHMGIYVNPSLREWFEKEYAKQVTTKLDMGAGCMRFKKLDQIPYTLIEELAKKVTVEQYIKQIENIIKKK